MILLITKYYNLQVVFFYYRLQPGGPHTPGHGATEAMDENLSQDEVEEKKIKDYFIDNKNLDNKMREEHGLFENNDNRLNEHRGMLENEEKHQMEELVKEETVENIAKPESNINILAEQLNKLLKQEVKPEEQKIEAESEIQKNIQKTPSKKVTIASENEEENDKPKDDTVGKRRDSVIDNVMSKAAITFAVMETEDKTHDEIVDENATRAAPYTVASQWQSAFGSSSGNSSNDESDAKAKKLSSKHKMNTLADDEEWRPDNALRNSLVLQDDNDFLRGSLNFLDDDLNESDSQDKRKDSLMKTSASLGNIGDRHLLKSSPNKGGTPTKDKNNLMSLLKQSGRSSPLMFKEGLLPSLGQFKVGPYISKPPTPQSKKDNSPAKKVTRRDEKSTLKMKRSESEGKRLADKKDDLKPLVDTNGQFSIVKFDSEQLELDSDLGKIKQKSVNQEEITSQCRDASGLNSAININQPANTNGEQRTSDLSNKLSVEKVLMPISFKGNSVVTEASVVNNGSNIQTINSDSVIRHVNFNTTNTDKLEHVSGISYQSPLSNLLSSQNVQLHIPSSVDIINSLTASPKRRQLPVLQQDNEHRKVTVSKIVDSTEKLTKVKPSPIKPKKPFADLKLNLDEFESANHAIDGDFNLDLEDFKSAKNLLDSGAKIDLDNLDSDRQSSQSSHHDLLPEKAVSKDNKSGSTKSRPGGPSHGKDRKRNKHHFGVKDSKLRSIMSPIQEDPAKLSTKRIDDHVKFVLSKTSVNKDSKLSESESKDIVKPRIDSSSERLSRADKPIEHKRSHSGKRRSASASRLERTTKELEDVKDKLSNLSPIPPDADRIPKPPPGHAPKNAAVLAR